MAAGGPTDGPGSLLEPRTRWRRQTTRRPPPLPCRPLEVDPAWKRLCRRCPGAPLPCRPMEASMLSPMKASMPAAPTHGRIDVPERDGAGVFRGRGGASQLRVRCACGLIAVVAGQVFRELGVLDLDAIGPAMRAGIRELSERSKGTMGSSTGAALLPAERQARACRQALQSC